MRSKPGHATVEPFTAQVLFRTYHFCSEVRNIVEVSTLVPVHRMKLTFSPLFICFLNVFFLTH